MTSGSSMLAITLSVPPQRQQRSISIAKTRLRRCAQVIARWRCASVLSGGAVPPTVGPIVQERVENLFIAAPPAHCLPDTALTSGGSSFMTKFVQRPELLVALREDVAGFRQIFLDGRDHADRLDPTCMGHSVGRWEGDTLVVDTIGFNDRGWTDIYPRTEMLRMEERYTRTDFGRLEVVATFDDPRRVRGALVAAHGLESRDGHRADGIRLRKQSVAGRRTMTRPIRFSDVRPSATARRSVMIVVLGLSLIGVQAAAHHAFSSVFDPEQPLSLEGTVTKVEWMNRHTWFYIDTSSEDGATEKWGFEMGSPKTLARRGWNRDSLRIGDEIIVVG